MFQDPKDVYSFIHQMSKAERRYFTLHQGRAAGDKVPHYRKFYEFILEAGIQSDEDLRRHPGGDGFHLTKNLSQEKRRLFGQLMKSLIAYDEDSSPSLKRYAALSTAEVLESRGCLTLAQESLDAIRERAELTGSWTKLMDVNYMEGRLGMASGRRLNWQEIEDRFGRRQEYLLQLAEESQLRLAWELLLSAQRQPLDPGASEAALRAERILGSISPSCLSNKLQWYRNQAVLHLIQADHALAQKAYREVIGLLVGNPILAQEHPKSTMLHFYNYLNVAHRNGDYGDFDALVPKVEALERDLDRGEATRGHYAKQLRIIQYANTGRLAEGAALAEGLLSEIPAPYPGLPPSSFITAHYNAFILLFLGGMHKRAKGVLDAILSSQRIRLRTELRLALHIFDTIIWFELGDESLMNSKWVNLNSRAFEDAPTRSLARLVLRVLKEWYTAKSEDQVDWAGAAAQFEVLQRAHPALGRCGVNELTVWARAKAEGVEPSVLLATHPKYRFPFLDTLAPPHVDSGNGGGGSG